MQSLAALDLRLGLLRRRIASAAPELTASVEVLQGTVNEVIGGLRHLLFELEVAEDRVTLADQLRDALEHVFADERVSTALRVEHGPGPVTTTDLPPAVRACAIRIGKEALANVLRHAQASTVVVTLRPDADGVEVAVVDDGVGPAGDVATLRSAPGHRGLDGMRDRAQVVGGWCRLERADGRTTLRFWLPRDDLPWLSLTVRQADRTRGPGPDVLAENRTFGVCHAVGPAPEWSHDHNIAIAAGVVARHRHRPSSSRPRQVRAPRPRPKRRGAPAAPCPGPRDRGGRAGCCSRRELPADVTGRRCCRLAAEREVPPGDALVPGRSRTAPRCSPSRSAPASTDASWP